MYRMQKWSVAATHEHWFMLTPHFVLLTSFTANVVFTDKTKKKICY